MNCHPANFLVLLIPCVVGLTSPFMTLLVERKNIQESVASFRCFEILFAIYAEKVWDVTAQLN